MLYIQIAKKNEFKILTFRVFLRFLKLQTILINCKFVPILKVIKGTKAKYISEKS